MSGEERAGGPEDRAMEEEDGGRRGEEPAEREGGWRWRRKLPPVAEMFTSCHGDSRRRSKEMRGLPPGEITFSLTNRS